MNIDIAQLPVSEQIEHYRKLAEDARRLAQSAVSPDRQRCLLAVADQWEGLATELERANPKPAISCDHA